MLNVFNRIVVVLLLAIMVLCTTLSAIAVWVPTVAPNLLTNLGQQTSALVAAASTMTPQTQA
ncbi:MAG TPA: hypothetical protein VER55_04575, partial [Ardenticatenaceae bacterium]|nr:hypothetical protein [Ardenticatenaceae bacterium]